MDIKIIKEVRGIYFVVAALIVVFVTVTLYWNDNEKIEIAVVERGIIYKEIFASGKVRPTEELRLSFSIGGRIDAIYAEEGQKISGGQILAELDTDELKSKLNDAQINLESSSDNVLTRTRDAYAKIDDAILNRSEQFFKLGNFGAAAQESGITYYFNTYDQELARDLTMERRTLVGSLSSWRNDSDPDLALERLKRVRDFLDDLSLGVSHFLTDRGSLALVLDGYRSSVSAAQLSINSAIINQEAAVQALLSAESAIEILQTQLKQTRLTAPFYGTILTREVIAGEVVKLGETVFTFYPADELLVEAEIYEGDIGFVAIGGKAKLEFVAFPDQIFEGEIVAIDSVPVLIDGVVHYIAKLRIINPPPQILPSMSVDVLFSLIQKENALVVPEAAIERRDGKAFARVLLGGNVEEREVVLGLRGSGGMIEILEGLSDKETVILR